MDRLNLTAQEREVLGKKVKKLRRDGLLPGHVFGKGVDGETVTVSSHDFLKTFHQAGETGLIDLKIGKEKIRPVLVREVQYDPISGNPIHIDFYQVNLSEKVKVPVPIVLVGEEPETVHLGETIVLQTLNEVEVEALPADLVEKIEVDISSFKNVDDAVTVGQLNYDKDKLIILADSEEIVAKLAPAVTAQMQELLEEEAAEQAEGPVEGETPVEGEEAASAEGSGQSKEGETPEKQEAEAEGKGSGSGGNDQGEK